MVEVLDTGTHPVQAGRKTLKITGSPAATPRNPAGLYK
jgi:hypothetical protein